MSKVKKVWLIIATSLIILGLTIFVIVMSVNGWDFKKLSTAEFETNTYDISEEFRNIFIKTNTADIKFVVSDDGKCKVICYEQENFYHSVNVKNDTLTINVVDDREWYEYIGISIGSPKITVYLPEKDYVSEMKVKASTGDIRFEDMSAKDIDFTTSTGDIIISNVDCKNNIKATVSTGKTKITSTKCEKLMSDGDTGDIILKNVIVAEGISIERDTGDVKFDRCDADEISVETDTGDITGTLLSDKIFFVETDTGKVNVPRTIAGGRCELETDTGDIEISISK